jgi:bacterioferritin-associated ferredoxin
MILCVCHGVRCTAVRAAIGGGAHTVDAVGSSCGAGTDCGACRGMIEDMIDEALEDQTASRVDARGRTHLAVSRSSA